MPRTTTNSSGNSETEGDTSSSGTQGAQGTSTQGSTNSTSNNINMYQAQRSTKLNLEPLKPDGDFAAFEEAFKAEMKVRRLAHHFPGLVNASLATRMRETTTILTVLWTHILSSSWHSTLTYGHLYGSTPSMTIPPYSGKSW
jgi:hypothetical protein